MNTALIPGSLAAVARHDNMSLAESFMSVDVLLLVDTSGSMAATDASGNRSRYQAACDELARLQNDLPGKVGVVSFSDGTVFCPSGVPAAQMGGTDMAGALRFAKQADDTGIRIVLISDGHPDDADETLKVAKTFTSHIDTIYIGPEGLDSGRLFLQRLADCMGGQNVKADGIALFAEPVKQLLFTA